MSDLCFNEEPHTVSCIFFSELLLQNSADLSCADELQNTALHYACMNVSNNRVR